MAKDYRRVACPVMFDMIPCAVQTENRYRYQLGAVISHLGKPQEGSRSLHDVPQDIRSMDSI
jgi:hypothetical protein